jgi:tetratricopeptide (TPR) repeat protein
MAHSMGAALRMAFAMGLLAVTGWSQFLPPLEAGSPEEFDDYLTVEASADPNAAVEFRKRWPNSAMLPRIYEIEFAAWRKLGDAGKARRAAEAALAAAPGNLAVKADLAVMLAAVEAAEAERMAHDTLSALDGFRVPRRISPDEWKRLSGAIRSKAHMTLGVVRFGKGDAKGALAELEEADRISPLPDPALCLRLGRLYAAMGRKDDARRQFQRAIETGDAVARPIAEQELKKLP